MTLYSGMRYNSFDHYRPPLAFGVEWDYSSSDPALTRIGDAAAMSVNNAVTPHDSDFDDYLPWSGMIRTATMRTGDIYSLHGEIDLNGASTFDETIGGYGLIMVSIPKFYYKVDYVPSTTLIRYWISPYPTPGFRLHPAFSRGVNYGNTYGVVENVYVGAYEGYYSTYIHSIANQTPAVSATRATFRTRTNLINTNFTLLDYPTYAAIQLLYLVEYASWDSQTMIGKGLTYAGAISSTGWTGTGGPRGCVDLGNGTGQVQVSGTNYAMSYRGIENLWGNTWTVLDAVNISTSKEIWVYEQGLDFIDQTPPAYPYYKDFRMASPDASGFIRYPAVWEPDADACWSFWPGTVVGGAACNYVCDHYRNPVDWSVARYPKVGGAYNSGPLAGLFAMDVTHAYATTAADTGARIMMLQYDNTGFYIY